MYKLNTCVKNRDLDNLSCLKELNKKVLWLSSWMIHNANYLRKNLDGLKVGGHQSSCASVSGIMTTLYFSILNPYDRVAVKPHASPVFHAIQYLLGNQTKDQMQRFRSFGGAQAYPSRTKDKDDVDFSTGSVGLGVGVTLFSALVKNYVDLHLNTKKVQRKAKMIAILGDAELDEGNIYEALLEGWKHDVRNLWWIVDYNRQSLDGVINDFLFQKIKSFFETVGWRVINVKYGKLQEAVFIGPAGEAIRNWIDSCPNDLYSALAFKGGSVWREHLSQDLKGVSGLTAFLNQHDDSDLHRIMTNLGGHDLATLLEAFKNAENEDIPTCFVVYTIKGYGLPLAGHKDNHAGLMTMEQMSIFKKENCISDGDEWSPFSGLDLEEGKLSNFIKSASFNNRVRFKNRAPIIISEPIKLGKVENSSTQMFFGRIMSLLGKRKDELSNRIVTTSPDVTVSTNLSGWVNLKGVFKGEKHSDIFHEKKVLSPIKWEKSPQGQHIELGIAENNLFLLLAAMGLSEQLFKERLIPIGTIYDTFIARGLDALNYACYQDARFILIGTPSGITLGPEGGAHQSIGTPLIGLSQDGLATFEPAFCDELEAIFDWSFNYIQRDGKGRSEFEWLRDKRGGSVYLRLSTRSIEQPKRIFTKDLRENILKGGYWLKEPNKGSELAIIFTGVIAPEALLAWEIISKELSGVGLLCVTSADRLNAGWTAAQRARQLGQLNVESHIEVLLSVLSRQGVLVTVTDSFPTILSWIGGVRGQRTESLGVEEFGQSGNLKELYESYRIDSKAIIQACQAVRRSRVRLKIKE